MTTAIVKDKFKTLLDIRDHRLIADEPEDRGGEDSGPTPKEYLEAALTSCTTITLQIYLQQKDWDVKEIAVTADVEVNDQYEYISIEKSIIVYGNLDQEQLDRIFLVSKKCPVHKFMQRSVPIDSSIKLV